MANRYNGDGWTKIVLAEGEAVLVRPEGTSDYGSGDEDGFPVLVENADMGARVLVWADINQEDPTHIITLDRARVSHRAAENED
jgi:predicted RNA-binding protein with TRAM domain